MSRISFNRDSLSLSLLNYQSVISHLYPCTLERTTTITTSNFVYL